MKKLSLLIALIIIVAVLFFVLRKENAPAVDVMQPISPLYGGLEWGMEKAVTLGPKMGINPTEDTLTGYEVISNPTQKLDAISNVTEPFRAYYEKELPAAGWQSDSSLSADGAGSSVWAYRKGNALTILSYRSDFLNVATDSPSQCPCTVTFDVFQSSSQ